MTDIKVFYGMRAAFARLQLSPYLKPALGGIFGPGLVIGAGVGASF